MKTILLNSIFLWCLNFACAQSGKLDPSFGINGIVNTDVGSFYDYNSSASQVLTKPDGSIFIILNATVISKRFPNGSIDSTFGFNGYSRSVSLGDAHAALQPDGKIVITGSQLNSSSWFDYFITRINANGTTDSAFGINGMQSVPLQARSVAVQSDGKIVVAGTSVDANNSYFGLVRFNKNGNFDSTFNGNGQATTDFKYKLPGEIHGQDSSEIHNATGTTIVIQPDGKIVAGGFVWTGYDHDFAIARYTKNGIADSTFNNNGKQTTDFGSASEDLGYSLAIQTDGKIILAGYASPDAINNYFAVARYNINGSIDNSFNGNGRQTANLISDGQFGNSVGVQSNNKIVVAGYAFNGTANDFAVARFNTDGHPDNSFDNDGILTTNIFAPSSDDYAESVAIQSDDKIILAGYSYTDNGSGYILTRYNDNGSLDNSFDKDGKLEGGYKQGYTRYNTSAIQTDGKVVTAGRTWNGTNDDFVITRYNINGSLDSTFSNDGKQITDFGATDEAISMAIQADGKIIVAGNSDNRTDVYQIAIARYNADGSPDNSFSTDGKLVTSIGAADVCQSVMLQSNGKIVLVGTSSASPYFDSAYFTIARLNSDGTTDNSFGVNGKQTANFYNSFSFATSGIIQKDGKILAAGRSVLDGQNNFSLVRLNTNGSFDTTFSHDGKQNNIFGPDDYFITSMAVQSDGKIIVAGSSETIAGVGPFSTSVAIARYQTNGDLDTAFNADGFQSTYLGPHFNFGTTVAFNDDGRIAVGGTNDDYAIVLYKKNGSRDSTFGTDGIQSTKIGVGNSSVQSVAFRDNKLYAAGYAQYPGNFGVVARYLPGATAGPTDSTFITGANGLWDTPATWIGGIVPNAASKVIVKHNVSITANNTCYSLKIEAPAGYLVIKTGAHLTIAH